MAQASAIHVQGLGELVRGFGRLEKSLRREMQRELRDVARIVSSEARDVAQAKRLRRTGDLIRSIKPSVRGGEAFVRASAVHRGYEYPRRLEFEGGRRAATDPTWYRGRGPRAFLEPALAGKQREVVDAFERMLDRLTSSEGFGRGGTL